MAELTDEQKKLFKGAFSKPAPVADPAPAQPGLFGSLFNLIGASNNPNTTTVQNPVGPDNAPLTEEQKQIFKDAFNKR